MNRLIISLFIFIFTLAFSAELIAAKPTDMTTGSNFSGAAGTLSTTSAAKAAYEDFVYVRVLIDGHWWTYVYTLEGSFIVAIPDDDDD